MKTEFNFAGFSFPRYIARMACGPAALRKKWAGRKFCGEYYHAPKPNNRDSIGFYLENDGMRWQWCDDVNTSIRHSGWYCDEYGDQKIHGIVIRLPHGKYLAGWSMGQGMASEIEYSLFDNAEECARYSDGLAEIAAELNRENME